MKEGALYRFVAILLLLAAALVACAPQAEEAVETVATEDLGEAPTEVLDRARTAADVLTGELVARLRQELDAGGPTQALQVCKVVAPRIAQSHSTPTMTVRRVSLKVRNPGDRPDAFEAEKLLELEGLHARGELPTEVMEVRSEDGRRTLRYLRPIVLAGPCMNCHGDAEAIDPGVRPLIQEMYPEDQATGYQVGDLRGAVSVRVALEPPATG
jgi:hypothetical protein